jgi:SAM-dependent methyltransferase
MPAKEHWDKIYSTEPANAVSWFQEHADLSLRLIRGTGVVADGSIIDDLLANGFTNVTVLDLSQAALSAARLRLGSRASAVLWLEADITRVSLPVRAYDVWHDRAVFHFLTAPEARAAYVQNVVRSVKSGGHAIVATFAEDGPTQCSGLPVVRYSADELHAAFGDRFSML